MRIEILTQEDPLYILPFFEEFFSNYASDFTILQVSCSPAMGSRSRKKMLQELTALYGPVGMARLLGIAAASKILGRFSRNREASEFYGVEQIANAYGVPYRSIGNPNQPEFVESVRQRKADVLVSVACPYILKSDLLSVPPRGCINIHHAPLPYYKGMMPTFWQMYHGEKTLGVTVHFMAVKIDEGEALLQETTAIQSGETLHELIRKSKRHGAHCMARALHQVETNNMVLKPLNDEKGSYFTFPTIEEIREFRRRGYRSI
jgi:methionyl-tRNA formyltransferase